MKCPFLFFFLSVFLSSTLSICAQENGSPSPQETASTAVVKINVSCCPNLWFAQPAIVKAEKWDLAAGLDFNLQIFPGPPQNLQAFAIGQSEVMYNNIGSALVAPTRGVPSRIIASTIKDDIFLAASPELMKEKTAGNAAEAIRQFVAKNGRKVKIATNPKGTLSDLILRYWMEHSFDHPEKWIEVINTGSQDQFQQSILSGDVDASAIFEPLFTIAHHLKPQLGIFATPNELMPDQPGGVVSINEEWAKKHPGVVKKLILLNARATQFLRDHPAEAARDVYSYFGKGLVNVEIYEESIRFDHDRFISDPAVMIAPTKIIYDYMRKNGYLTKDLDVAALFNLEDSPNSNPPTTK